MRFREPASICFTFVFCGLMLVALLLVSKNCSETIERYQQLRISEQITKAASDLIHELQKERGLSVGSLATAGQESAGRQLLLVQRPVTDEFINGYVARIDALPNSLKLTRAVADAVMARDVIRRTLDGIRTAIDAGSGTITTAFQVYTSLIDVLQDNNATIMSNYAMPDVAHQITDLDNIALAKEYAGLERALGTVILSTKTADDVLMQRLQIISDLCDRFMRRAFKLEYRKFDNLVVGFIGFEAAQRYSQMRNAIGFSLPAKNSVQPGSSTWWNVSTQRIDGMKAIDDSRRQDLKDMVEAQIQSSAITAYTVETLIVAVLGFMALLGLGYRRSQRR